MIPLAERLRPHSLDEMVGQPHLFGEGRPMRRILASGKIPNMIFYGPSGVGKTTLARMIADHDMRFHDQMERLMDAMGVGKKETA